MPRVSWLPRVLRSAGIDVVEIVGWHGRGVDRLTVQGVVCHHTATGPKTSDEAVARLLRDGRPDLPGPLCQLGLDRRGRAWMIADGRGNHNGYGTWGNDAIGIEAFNSGVGEPWPRPQIDAYERICAAICRHHGWSSARVKGHKETDARRKIDPAGIDMSAMRSRIDALVARPPTPDLELTMGQYEEIMKAINEVRADVWKTKAQLDVISGAVHGTDDSNRDASILLNTTYLRSELLGGDNAQRLREILHQYGVPKAAVTIIADP